MPTIDGGHVFLTVLAPVRRDPFRRADGSLTSPQIALREALAVLPTARQSAACAAGPCDSPFSRNTYNHFVRMAVISNAAFNGRDHTDAIRNALPGGSDPAIAKPSDALASPYLMWAADIDVDGDPRGAQSAYLETLWRTMQPELHDVFRHCVGFDAVKDAAAFCAWVRRCQIDTTMPFNDYWARPPAGKPPGLWAKIKGLLFGTVFPTAPDSDLPSVLKALYLQRRFVPFAVAVQGASDEDLFGRFGDFIAAVAPAAPTPTQAPGEVGG